MTYHAVTRDGTEIVRSTRAEFAEAIKQFILSDPGGEAPDDEGRVGLEIGVSEG